MTQTPQIVCFRERLEDEMGFSICRTGGCDDGHEFRQVEVTMSDGSKRWYWKSNVLPGFFKQVFLPWDFEDHQIVKF